MGRLFWINISGAKNWERINLEEKIMLGRKRLLLRNSLSFSFSEGSQGLAVLLSSSECELRERERGNYLRFFPIFWEKPGSEAASEAIEEAGILKKRCTLPEWKRVRFPFKRENWKIYDACGSRCHIQRGKFTFLFERTTNTTLGFLERGKKTLFWSLLPTFFIHLKLLLLLHSLWSPCSSSETFLSLSSSSSGLNPGRMGL